MMQPLYTNEKGDLLAAKGYEALAARGSELLPAAGYIPLPKGATFTAMPGRAPLMRTKDGNIVAGKGTAVAVLLPQGFSRMLLPATKTTGGPEVLPLLGYTAAAMEDGKVYVAAKQTDEHKIWHPDHYNTADLPERIAKVKKLLPENRIIAQLTHCSLTYGCFTAQNIFYRRWEGGLPVSKTCNARCIGCISEQAAECCPSAQGRISFSPTVKEIAEVGAFHLNGEKKENIISFGQGCEGEPSLAAEKIVKAMKVIRDNTDQGTINMNTNAGHTECLQKIVDGGIDTLRVSLFSAVPDHYKAYYRPKNYALEDVEGGVAYAVDQGVYVSLNLLAFPGFSDRDEEIEALCGFIFRTGLQKVQIRNLNIDADYFYRACGFIPSKSQGMEALIAAIHACGADVGNYSRPRR
ncbi:MAG TPA: radical SAM protein [Clostridiales bacterium]|nr:radical SAM protein [Clostridiales bacterium]